MFAPFFPVWFLYHNQLPVPLRSQDEMASDAFRRSRKEVQQQILDRGLDGVRNPSSAARLCSDVVEQMGLTWVDHEKMREN